MTPTVSHGQRALAASPAPRKRPGPRVNPDWRTDMLHHYEQIGGFYASAKLAGVDSSTVYDEMARDPAFRAKIEEAKQRYADSREQNLARLANEGNVVGDIVLLKKFRPSEYIEKNLSISASFTTQLDPAAGQALLQTMLGQLGPSTAPVMANPLEAQRFEVLPAREGQAETPAHEGGKT